MLKYSSSYSGVNKASMLPCHVTNTPDIVSAHRNVLSFSRVAHSIGSGSGFDIEHLVPMKGSKLRQGRS